MDLKGELVRRILAGDRQGAVTMLDERAAAHGYERVVTEILEPALLALGERWTATEDISLAQGFIAGKVAEDVLRKAAESQTTEASDRDRQRGPVVIGNIEDDAHALGRKLVGIFLRTAGWEVHDLGNDVPAADFVEKAVAVGAPIIGASAMMYTTAMNIKELRREIDARGLTDRVQLAVGGAVFVQRPELVDEVGGDGTARNAMQAPELMGTLLQRSQSRGSGR